MIRKKESNIILFKLGKNSLPNEDSHAVCGGNTEKKDGRHLKNTENAYFHKHEKEILYKHYGSYKYLLPRRFICPSFFTQINIDSTVHSHPAQCYLHVQK